MGLQSQLSDVSSENILVIATVLVARGARYLRSLFVAILRGLSLQVDSSYSSSQSPSEVDEDSSFLDDVVGSGLSGVVLLCEQLRRSRAFSYRCEHDGGGDCVVCLNRIDQGHSVRRLPCLHVFHSDCLDGWLRRLNFSCPLCRAPSWGSDACVEDRRRAVAVDLLTWLIPPTASDLLLE